MIFLASLQFVVFLVSVLAIYWASPARWRNALLVPGEVSFSTGLSTPWFLLPFAATTIIDYFVARGIEAQPERKKITRRGECDQQPGRCSRLSNTTISSSRMSPRCLGRCTCRCRFPCSTSSLPAGISMFYTFPEHRLSVVDVLPRSHKAACRSLRDYALFVSFFPAARRRPDSAGRQPAGADPRNPRSVNAATLVGEALVLIAWGFFKKLVIADNVAITANKVFAMQSPSFAMLWTGVLAHLHPDLRGFFGLHRYCARGTSLRLFGFRAVAEFQSPPYLADSPSDFWRRWHISLSTWIREYIFIPLGSSRGGGPAAP